MATPLTGPISFADLRSQISRETTGAIDMSEMRIRYDTNSALSVEDLRGAEGFEINCGANTITIKSGTTNVTGWAQFPPAGNPIPDEFAGSNNGIELTTSAWITSVETANGTAVPNTNQITFDDDLNDAAAPGIIANVDNIPSGFKPADLSRIVIANTNRPILSSLNNFVDFDGDRIPNSGIVTVLLVF